MGQRDKQQTPGLLSLLSIASTASALSLANFQGLTSPAATISCIVAYNTQIQGCTTADFTKGNACSTACVTGLTKTQANVKSVCQDPSVTASSILGHALLGDLVSFLCPSTGTTVGASNPVVSTQTNVVITTSRTQTTLQTRLSTSTVARGTTTTATQRGVNTSPALTFPAQTSNTVPTTTLGADPEPSDQPGLPEPPATSQQTGRTTSVTPPQTSETSQEAAQATADSQTLGVGRGSPFDNPVLSASPHLLAHWSQASIVAAIVAMALLR